jgi:hypothetical protein
MGISFEAALSRGAIDLQAEKRVAKITSPPRQM